MSPLKALRPLPTIFVVPSMVFVFLGESDWLNFFKIFHVGSSCWVPATTKRLLTTCFVTVTQTRCKGQGTSLAPPHPTPLHQHHNSNILCTTLKYTTVKNDNRSGASQPISRNYHFFVKVARDGYIPMLTTYTYIIHS